MHLAEFTRSALRASGRAAWQRGDDCKTAAKVKGREEVQEKQETGEK